MPDWPMWFSAGLLPIRRRSCCGRAAGGGWRDVTAAQFRAEVTGLAKGLIAAGIQPGDRVALLSRTRYEWTLADYAIWAAGAVTVPVYETSSAEQVEWIVSDAGARAVIAETDAHAEIIASLRDRLPELSQVWRISGLDERTATGADVTDDELRQHTRRAAARATWPRLIYTSGSTGRPMGCEPRRTEPPRLSGIAVHGAPPEISETTDSSTLLPQPWRRRACLPGSSRSASLESGAVLGHWGDIGDRG
jgi:long-chain acyl-CoA synthetase